MENQLGISSNKRKIIVITGKGGSGKTTLIVRAYNEILEKYKECNDNRRELPEKKDIRRGENSLCCDGIKILFSSNSDNYGVFKKILDDFIRGDYDVLITACHPSGMVKDDLVRKFNDFDFYWEFIPNLDIKAKPSSNGSCQTDNSGKKATQEEIEKAIKIAHSQLNLLLKNIINLSRLP